MYRLTFPRKLYDFFIKHWLLTALVMTVPSYYFILLRNVGTTTGLMNEKNELTIIGLVIFCLLLIISLSFTILKLLADKYNEQIKYNGQIILEKILSGSSATIEKKLHRFCEYININHEKRVQNPFPDITQPKLQIIDLLDNIQVSLSVIFGIRREDIGLSILFKTDKKTDDGWKYFHTVNIDNDMQLDALLKNPNTTARQIIDGKDNILFFADKRKGIEQKKYVAGPKDAPYNNIGSICCKDISVDTNENVLKLVEN